MANPIQSTIDALNQAINDTNKWADETAATCESGASKLVSDLEGAIDDEIAKRCADAINSAATSIKQAAASAAEEVAEILKREIGRLEAILA